MRITFVVVALLMFGSCIMAPLRRSVARSDSEYQVYSAVLDTLYRGAARRSYFVRDSTVGQLPGWGPQQIELMTWTLRQIPEASPELIDRFAERNRTPTRLDRDRFRTRKPVVLISRSAEGRLMRAWGDGELLPDTASATGILTLSRVGLSPDGSQAAVHVLDLCGGRCGSGEMILLERRGRKWIVIRTSRTIVV